MPSIVDLIGEQLISGASGETTISSSLSWNAPGTVVGLYFSAHWCSPCRAFTPLLAEFYNRIRSSKDKNGDCRWKQFEIVFVTSDTDVESFNEHLKEMPWQAIPFENNVLKAKISKKYRITEIPALVLVEGSTGKLITANGRDCLSDDLEGLEFPWYPKPLIEILSGSLLKNDGSASDYTEALQGKIKGIYFSAHWCPPCRAFTPQLVDVYDKVKASGQNFEILFVSFDRSTESFTEYYKTMPWLTMPYQDPRVKQLTKRFEIEGIPALIILDENNQVICSNGRSAIGKDPEGKNFPWPLEPVEELNESNASALQDSACLILFTDGDVELIGKAKDLLMNTASQYISEQKTTCDTAEELPSLRFFYEGLESDEIADSIRTFAQIDGRKPLMAIVDMAEQKVYTAPENDISNESLSDLVNKFKTCSLDFMPITE